MEHIGTNSRFQVFILISFTCHMKSGLLRQNIILEASSFKTANNDNLKQDLADRRMANPIDPVVSHQSSQERQLAAVPELPNNNPHRLPTQSHAEDHAEQIEAKSGEDHRRRTGRLQSRKEYHRADLEPTHSL